MRTSRSQRGSGVDWEKVETIAVAVTAVAGAVTAIVGVCLTIREILVPEKQESEKEEEVEE